MKKLFALLLALCLVCGVGCAGAEFDIRIDPDAFEKAMDQLGGTVIPDSIISQYESLKNVTGTFAIGPYTFDIPEGWLCDATNATRGADAEGDAYDLGLAANDYLYNDSMSLAAQFGLPGNLTSPFQNDVFVLTREDDPAIRFTVTFAPVTSKENSMDVMRQNNMMYPHLEMVSPAEMSVYTWQATAQRSTSFSSKIDFVTIGTFVDEPVRRTYSGFIGSYVDAEGNAQKARVSAVVWSSDDEDIAREIVIQQITPQYAENYDHVVDEFMMSFRRNGKAGSYDESAITTARNSVNASDFDDFSIIPVESILDYAAYLFDLTVNLDFDMTQYQGMTFDEMNESVLSEFDMTVDEMLESTLSEFDLGDIDLSDSGALGDSADSGDLSGFDSGSFDMGGFDMSGFDMDSFDMDSFGSFLGQ